MHVLAEYPQDTIEFALTAEKTLTNDTVRMTVPVVAVLGSLTEDQLRQNIHTALRQLINTDWNLSNIRRETGNDGNERVNLSATARVAETENSNLEDRLHQINRKGLKLHMPQVDYSFPLRARADAERDMRAELLKRALDECKTVSEASNREYRVASLNVYPGFDPEGIASSNSTYSNAMPMRATVSSGGGGMGVTEKLSLTAAIKLSALVPLPQVWPKV